MTNQYHLSTSGTITKCQARMRVCPREVHITEEGKANIAAGSPKTLNERKLWNLKVPAKAFNLVGATPDKEKDKIKHLSREQVLALEHYSAMDYYEINEGLRAGDRLSPFFQRIVDQLDSIFAVIKPERPYVTYRGETLKLKAGENVQDAVMRKFFPGSTVTSKSFFSTSVNPSIAAYFAKKNKVDEVSIILEVKAKTGVSLQGLDVTLPEDEMLLPRNSSFTVTKVRPYASYQDIDYGEETSYLKENQTRTQIFTVVLEEQ